MSSSTALLPKDRQRDDHPIFLRVCHSPWVSLGQKALCGLRGLTTAYLFTVSAMIVRYEIKNTKHGYLAFFEFTNISMLMLVLYHLIAFTWTFMHLHYPHLDNSDKSFTARVQRLFSPPHQNPNTKNRTWFSIFYMAVNTSPWVSTLIHWAVLVPMNKATIPANKVFSQGWFPASIIMNRYAIAPFITLLEVLFFSSIRRPTPVYAHIFGLSFFVWCYIGWVYVGYIILDKYAFFFLDHKQVGWDYVASSWAAFTATEVLFLWVIYCLIALREGATSKGDRRGDGGYQQIPQ